ncbi:MAG TPA: cytochrome c maturation protein CcmE [Acidimicrobiales bacterium]|nr:cytochrome c maturation protein CcmE [Acidimicrobiales bacterium]
MTGTSTESRPPLTPAVAAGRSVVASAAATRRRRTRRRLMVVFALLAAALVFLLVEGLGSSLDYFDTVNQALAHRAQLGTATFRLEGNVVAGSIRSTATGADFRLSQGDHVVPVANSGSPPQLFQANIPVVVVGHFASTTSDDFVSNSIEVKHSSTYIAQYPSRVKGKNGKVLP